jgi:glycosyltransferase involved in cell wall biosynthesis
MDMLTENQEVLAPMNPLPKPVVVYFNSLLLPASQTFIRSQGEMLQQFTAHYVGSRRVEGLDLPCDRTWVVNPGQSLGPITEAWFKLSGMAPHLYRHIRQLNPALIHAQFGLSGALALPLAKSLNLPLIVHFRGADATVNEASARYTSLNHWIYFRRRNALKREARLFLTVSKFIKDKIVEQGFPPDKILTHYNGVNLTQFRSDPYIEREPIVLFVGRLTEKKGCEYLIQAMSQVQRAQPDIKLVIIGDGPLRSKLETEAQRSLQHYQFLGVQPPEAVKHWMNRARILAAPSVTAAEGDSEGLPNVVVEAQAMQLPVVSTVHAGIPEAVVHGETGFLAPERDPEKLAFYCLQLLNHSDLWQQFSLQGRTHVEANFNRIQQTRRLEEIYQSIWVSSPS